MKKYSITYNFKHHENGIAKDELTKDDGACDGLVIGSILYPEDGSYDQQVYGLNGKEARAMTDKELFKFWAVLAASLSQSKTLDAGRKGLCERVHEIICEGIKKSAELEKE